MIDDRHDSNQELMAPGALPTLCSPLFGGIAATGAIARTATNIKCGARSPIAGIIHALTLLHHHSGRRAAGQIHSARHPQRRARQRRAFTWANGTTSPACPSGRAAMPSFTSPPSVSRWSST
jgi:hypothetical protein